MLKYTYSILSGALLPFRLEQGLDWGVSNLLELIMEGLDRWGGGGRGGMGVWYSLFIRNLAHYSSH